MLAVSEYNPGEHFVLGTGHNKFLFCLEGQNVTISITVFTDISKESYYGISFEKF